MQDDACPIDTAGKRCAIVSDHLINSLGTLVSDPVSRSDLVKMINMSDVILYNEGNTMRGREKIVAVNPANSGSWLRLNVSDMSGSDITTILGRLNCR